MIKDILVAQQEADRKSSARMKELLRHQMVLTTNIQPTQSVTGESASPVER